MKYECLPDSIVKIGCDVKRRSSLHKQNISRTCINSLITCYSPNWDVILSISDPSELVASSQNQVFHFPLKSPTITARKGLFSAYISRFVSRLPMKF